MASSVTDRLKPAQSPPTQSLPTKKPPARIHPTALVENNVHIGDGSSVWDSVHIRHTTTIGQDCIIGEKTYIAYGVTIGHRVKINAMVYICNAVTLEDGVMISAGTIFTNDRFPRATTPDLKYLRSSDPDEHTLPTLVQAGATIGAGCTIGNDLTIGRFAMVGMGSLVTKSVPDFHLVMGHPARSVGCVCRCGQLLKRFPNSSASFDLSQFSAHLTCSSCGLAYDIQQGQVLELTPP